MTSMGVIEGGWEFVWGAYGVTASVLVLYALSIHSRYRAERRRAAREGRADSGAWS
jgi:heme exporter protein CcmD